ncbi:MAG: cell division protein ZapA [Tissierellales bacterium]|nr:cell division protein ZapA [Tissierellales bacterium]
MKKRLKRGDVMPEYYSYEINICGKKYRVQTDENKEYVKKIEELINSKINQFKKADKNFDNYASLIFTTFVISDKYLKVLTQLEAEKRERPEFISLAEVKRIKDEKNQLAEDLDKTVLEKDKYLQELIQKNSEVDILKSKLMDIEKSIETKEEEVLLMEEMMRELEQKNKKLSHDLFLLREEIEIRD